MLARLDPLQAAGEMKTLEEYVARSVATPRFTAFLVGMLRGIRAAAGRLRPVRRHGVLGGAAATRDRDPDGARRTGRAMSAALIVAQALRMGAAGLAIGLVGALFVTRVLDSLLFGVSPSDPLTFAAVSAALVTVLLLAAYLPARRATRVDPMIALRTE